MYFINDDDFSRESEESERGMFRADAGHECLVDGAGAEGGE